MSSISTGLSDPLGTRSDVVCLLAPHLTSFALVLQATLPRLPLPQPNSAETGQDRESGRYTNASAKKSIEKNKNGVYIYLTICVPVMLRSYPHESSPSHQNWELKRE